MRTSTTTWNRSHNSLQRSFTLFLKAERSSRSEDDPCVRKIVEGAPVPVQLYGIHGQVDWSVEEVSYHADGIYANIVHRGRTVASGKLPLIGLYNLLNVVAAIAATQRVGIEPQRAMNALARFQGVRRRQEMLGEERGVMVIDDFAHHPTAVQVTIAGVRQRFPERRVIAVFEPRTNTSRRSIFQQSYLAALASADAIVVRSPRDVDKIPERDRFDSERLAHDLRDMGVPARAFADTDAIHDYLVQEVRAGDVVLIMSNGSFDNLGKRLLESLKEPAT